MVRDGHLPKFGPGCALETCLEGSGSHFIFLLERLILSKNLTAIMRNVGEEMNLGVRKRRSLFLPSKLTASFPATHCFPLLSLKTSVTFGSLVSIPPIEACCTLPKRSKMNFCVSKAVAEDSHQDRNSIVRAQAAPGHGQRSGTTLKPALRHEAGV